MAEDTASLDAALSALLSRQDIERFFERVRLEPGEARETAGEIHTLLTGPLRVTLEAPLRGTVQWDARPGDCFGGSALLPEEVLESAPELQLLSGRMRAPEAAEVLVLPLHIARQEPSLRRFVRHALGSLIARMNRPAIHRGLRGLPALAQSPRRALSAALDAASVLSIERGAAALEVPARGAAVLLSGEASSEDGALLERFECAPGGARLVSPSRAMLLLLEQLGPGLEASPSELVALERSRLWSRVPTALDPRALVVEHRFAAGEVLSDTTGERRRGEGALDGALFFLLEGEVRVTTNTRALPRRVGRHSWVGGEAWVGEAVRSLPGGQLGSRIVARTSVRALVAARGGTVSEDTAEALRGAALGQVVLELCHGPIAAALRRIPKLQSARPSALESLVDSGDILYLQRGARIRAPAGELFVPLQENLSVSPLAAERRFIPTPPAFTPLGVAEFFQNQRPDVAWEASRSCWLFRLDRSGYRSCLRGGRARLPELGRGAEVFDRIGGAEILVLDAHAAVGADRALPVLGDLLAQAMVRQFGDLVLVVRVSAREGRAEPAVEEGSRSEPDRLSIRVPPERVAEALTPHLRQWNEDYATILLIAADTGPVGRAVREQLAPFAERLVYLTRDPTADTELAVAVDCAVHYAVLLPEEAWPNYLQTHGAPAWAPGGVHPGFPEGAVRLRLDLDSYCSPRDLGLIPAGDRARFERWARSLTDRLLGVALGGGGAYGFVHVALLMELERLGLPVDVISGASVGATVGALYTAAGAIGLQELVRLSPFLARTTHYNMLSMRFMSGYIDTMLVHLEAARGTLRHPSEQPLVCGHWPVVPEEGAARRSLRRRLREALSWSPPSMLQLARSRDEARWTHYRYLQDFEIPFYPVATDLETGSEVALEVGPLAEGVRASGSFPGACPTSPHPNDPLRRLIDGGFAANVPDAALARQGVGLVVVSNPIPPPSASPHGGRPQGLEQLAHPSEWPLLRRGFQIYRATHILLHTVGDRDRAAVGASYQAPSSEYGLLDIHKAREIAELPFAQEEFHEVVREIQQAWACAAAPRRPEQLLPHRREEQWTELATTGWAVVFPAGTGPDDPRYQALHPLIQHRREAIRAGGSASRLQVFMGEAGYRPGQSAEQFIEAAGGTIGEHRPSRLGYHVLLVGSPEEIPFDFQIELDQEYAVGRLWLGGEDEPARLAAYARRLLAAERGGWRGQRRLKTSCLALAGEPLADKLRERFFPALRGQLATRGPGIEQLERDRRAGEPPAEAARAIFGGSDAELLLAAGPHWMARAPLEEGDRERLGWPLIDGQPLPLSAVTGARGPRVAVLFGSFSGGADTHSRYAFMAEPPALHYPERPTVSRFAIELLASEGGPLAVAGKLDLAWLVPPFVGRRAETSALVEALELILQGRTAGAALQVASDFCQIQRHMLAKVERLGLDSDGRLTEQIQIGIESARCWLLLGDPAVRIG